MTKLQEFYFNLRYKNRIEATQKYLKESEKIKNKKEKKEFLISKKKSVNLNYRVNKNFIKSELFKLTNDEKNIDNLYKELISFFQEYHELYTKYYNEERSDLFADFYGFIQWYKKYKGVCGYCGITAKELETIAIKRGDELARLGFIAKKTKNFTLNGKQKRSSGELEIERKDSLSNKYTYENSIFACPICNNAKSNLINEKDWRSIFVPAVIKFYEAQK